MAYAVPIKPQQKDDLGPAVTAAGVWSKLLHMLLHLG